MRLWRLIFNLAFTVTGWLSSVIALWQIYCVETVSIGFFIFCMIISVISIIYIVGEVHLYKREYKRIFVHSNTEQVNDYLYDWIKNGSRTVIFTRDFTWADSSSKMSTMLEDKARRHELIVCLCQSTSTTNKLRDLGAEIYIHKLHDLKSRFTIIHYGTNSPQITIAHRSSDGSYVNKRYSMQYDSHIYNIFVELFESTKATCKEE